MATLFAGLTASQLPRPLTCSYVPNRTARLTQESSVVIELLIDQVDHPVLWKQSIEALLQAGHTQAVEFGPGKVLQGLCKRIPAPDGRTIAATGVSDVDTLKAFGGTLK
jgi:[acyl-carrier-protein] S-malonyltransferase